MPQKRTYRLKVDKILEECDKRAWEFRDLAHYSGVDAKTITNVLKHRERASQKTLLGFSRALNIDHFDLILSDNVLQKPPAIDTGKRRIAVEWVIDDDPKTSVEHQTLDEHQQVAKIVEEISRAFGAQCPTIVLKWSYGSIIVTVEMDEEDFQRLLRAYANNALDAYRLQSIHIPDPSASREVLLSLQPGAFWRRVVRRIGFHFFGGLVTVCHLLRIDPPSDALAHYQLLRAYLHTSNDLFFAVNATGALNVTRKHHRAESGTALPPAQ